MKANAKKHFILIAIHIHIGNYPKNRISRIEELLQKRYVFFKKLDNPSKKRIRLAEQYLGQLERLSEYARKKELAKVTKTTYSKTLVEVEDYSYIEEYMDDDDDWFGYEPTYKEIEVCEEKICVSKPFQTISVCSNGEIKVSARAYPPTKYADRASPKSRNKRLPNSISRSYHM